MNVNFEISAYNNMLLYKNEYSLEFIEQTIKDNNLNGLRIFSTFGENKLKNLLFIEKCIFLEGLEIASLTDFDFTPIKKLNNLKYLSIEVFGENQIDLSNFLNLERLSLRWRKKIYGLNNCLKLKQIFLGEFSEKDLSIINPFQQLEELIIKTSKIQDLKNTTNSALKRLIITDSKKVKSISWINNLNNLESIELNSCPNITDFDKLNSKNTLKKLVLTDCGIIENSNFIQGFPNLEVLIVSGKTKFITEDFTFASKIKSFIYRIS